MTSPSISVVIPHFRSLETIGRALASVLSQSVLPNEIIVVDDASGEEYLRGLQEITSLTPFPVHIESLQQNSGPGTARNVGWDLANCDLVAFLDADDIWHPEKIECQVEAFRKLPALAVIGGQRPQVATMAELAGSVSVLDSPIKILTAKCFLTRNPLPTSSIVVRRDVHARFPDGQRFAEDHALLIRLSKEGTCGFIERPLCAAFKDDFGASGLSAHIFRMAGSEYCTFVRAFQAGTINAGELTYALSVLTGRVVRRFVRQLIRVIRRRLDSL